MYQLNCSDHLDLIGLLWPFGEYLKDYSMNEYLLIFDLLIRQLDYQLVVYTRQHMSIWKPLLLFEVDQS